MATAISEKTMQILTQKETFCKHRITMVIVCAAFVLLTGHIQRCFAQQPDQKTFSSAEEGIRGLFLAVKENNADTITAILGVESNLVSQDEQVQNKSERTQFIEKYQQMRRLVREPDGTMVL